MRELDDQNLARMIGYSLRQYVTPTYQSKVLPRSYYFSIAGNNEEVEHDLDDSPPQKVKSFIANPKFLEEVEWFCEENIWINKLFHLDSESDEEKESGVPPDEEERDKKD